MSTLMVHVCANLETFADQCRLLSIELERVAQTVFALDRQLRIAQTMRDTGRVIFGNILTKD